MSSIGVDFKSKQIEIDDKLIKLQIWDTAGHEKFRTITTSYYKSAHAIIILYDITEQSSFDHINNWMIEIDKFAKQGVLRIIVGNKKDLESKRQVSTKDAESFGDKYSIKLMEISAKDNTNIDALFLNIIKRLLENYLKSKGDIINTPSTNNVVLKKDKNLNKKKKCC